jgi:hypothetical protein
LRALGDSGNRSADATANVTHKTDDGQIVVVRYGVARGGMDNRGN